MIVGQELWLAASRFSLAWRRGLEAAPAKPPDEVTPSKALPGTLDVVKEVVRTPLPLCNFLQGGSCHEIRLSPRKLRN
jgi:hypothetical protein